MNQITVIFLVAIIKMSSLVAEKSEGTCSEGIQAYLVKENVTDENLIQKIQEVERIKAEFDRLSPPDKLTFERYRHTVPGTNINIQSIPAEEAEAAVQKLLQQREECVANITRLAEYKEQRSIKLQKKWEMKQQQNRKENW